MDSYGLDIVKRRKAQLEAEIDVLDAQSRLRLIYFAELQEIEAFLSAMEAGETEGNWGGVADDAPGPHNPDLLEPGQTFVPAGTGRFA